MLKFDVVVAAVGVVERLLDVGGGGVVVEIQSDRLVDGGGARRYGSCGGSLDGGVAGGDVGRGSLECGSDDSLVG